MLLVLLLFNIIPRLSLTCAATSHNSEAITTTSSTTSTSTSTLTSTSTSTSTTTTTATCPAGWSQYLSNCYIFENTPLYQPQAQAACQALGGNLASIHSAAENTFINNLAGKVTAWIGVVRTTTGVNMFKNIDGTPFDYTNWDVSNPDDPGGIEDCMVMVPSGAMNTANCATVIPMEPFICEKPL